jgi:solute carrier family 39 (zinc transporter), member 9
MAGNGAVAVGALSAVMFIASFGAGTLPLAMSLSQQRMNIVTSLGVGLLVGTSLGVVLPEGVEMLYTSAHEAAPVTRHRLIRAELDLATRQANADPGLHEDTSFHLPIALALVLGYLVMHLLTFLPPLLLERHPQSPIPLSSLPSSPHLERVPSRVLGPDSPTGLSNTTIGLCIHSMADGIALGSSAVSHNLALEGIVFLAIMLHKVFVTLRSYSDS